MQLVQSADFRSRFSTLSPLVVFNTLNVPNVLNVHCTTARAQSCAGPVAPAGGR